MGDDDIVEFTRPKSYTWLKVSFALMTVVAIGLAAVLALTVTDVIEWDDDDDHDEPLSPLTSYVRAQDDVYNWELSGSGIKKEGYTLYNVYLTSGLWLTATDSSTNLQTHWMQVCVPDDLVDPTFGALWIHGGKNSTFENPPNNLDEAAEAFCIFSKSISVGLTEVPNQACVFQGDPTQQERTEDAVIAWTWAHYINNTLEPDWLARMPMTRAAIRALDATQEFWASISPDQPQLEKFVVGGASKRGWTTWMVGSMGDDRVVGIVPVVAPIANINPQLNEQWRSYGEWSWVLADYYELGLMGWLNTPVFAQMLTIIDPLFYKPEIKKVRKYQIGATNDEFFMPDALQWYWDDIPGEKIYRILPNADHGLGTEEQQLQTLMSVATFLMSFKEGTEYSLPTYDWTISEDALTISVKCSTHGLQKVVVWKSENKPDRDWRQFFCDDDEDPGCFNTDATWIEVEAVKKSKGKYTYTLDAPMDNRYSAFFLELHYEVLEGSEPLVVSSDVSVAPNTFPFDPCGDLCNCGWDCDST